MTQAAPKHCISLVALHQILEAMQWVKVWDGMTGQVLPQQTCYISVPSSVFHRTHMCVSFKKSALSQREVFMNTVNTHSPFLGEPQQGCSESTWPVLIICVIFTDLRRFNYRSVPQPRSLGKPTIFTLADRFRKRVRPLNMPQYILCAAKLRSWLSHKRRATSFAVLMVWRQQTKYISDCCFCIVPPLQQRTYKMRVWALLYKHMPPATQSVPHGGLLLPKTADVVTLESEK